MMNVCVCVCVYLLTAKERAHCAKSQSVPATLGRQAEVHAGRPVCVCVSVCVCVCVYVGRYESVHTHTHMHTHTLTHTHRLPGAFQPDFPRRVGKDNEDVAIGPLPDDLHLCVCVCVCMCICMMRCPYIYRLIKSQNY